MVRQEIRRVLLSPFFYLSIIIFVICSFLVNGEDIPHNSDILSLFEYASYGHFRELAPILAGLAIADSYLIEKKSGYYYAVMSRAGRMKYCLSKVGTAIAFGVITVFIADILFLLGVAGVVKMIHGEISVGDYLLASWIDSGAMPYWLLRRNYLMFALQVILYDCLYASIFPAMAFAVSVFCSNKYVVLLASYIYANIMDVIFVGLKLFYISPMVLPYRGRATLLPHEGLQFRIIVPLVYWGIETLIFYCGVNRELKK